MFEKTQKAATELSAAVTEDANNAINAAKATVIPMVAGLFGTLADYAGKLKENVESGDLFAKAPAAAETPAAPKMPEADPLPTEEQNITINVLRRAGKSDAEIAQTLGVSIRTVAMAFATQAR